MKSLLFVALMGVTELAKGIQYFDSIRTGYAQLFTIIFSNLHFLHVDVFCYIQYQLIILH